MRKQWEFAYWLAVACWLLSFSAAPARGQDAQQHERYRYRPVSVDRPPVVDGDLSDAAWREAAVMDHLVQQIPSYGKPSSENTEIRVIYDTTALYIGVYCHDSDPGGVVRNVLRFRDDDVWRKDDVIRFVIDTFHEHRRTYVFAANALGAKQDAQIDNETWHMDWDEVWDVRARWQENGWSAEFRIPFRILRFPIHGDGVWGFNVERIIKRRNERSYWAPIPPSVPLARPAYYGHLEGMNGIEARRNWQLIPYGLTGIGRSGGRTKFNKDLDAGGDLKLGLTSALALDLTYNPDFSQVEADDVQINLTRFSLFFPEKREFFLENAQLFDFGLPRDTQLFFSRQIGLTGNEPVPIWGGARVSGKAGPFDLGLLSTQTEHEGKYLGTNLSAMRLRWNVGRRSYVGGIFTSVESKAQGNRIFGPDALVWLRRYLRWEGFLGVEDDQNVSKRPITFSTALVYDSDSWGVNLRTLRVEREFNPALGFVRRRGLDRKTVTLRRGWRLNRDWARKVDVSADLTYLSDRPGTLDTRQWGLEAVNELDSGDKVRVRLDRSFERISPAEPAFVINQREGIVIPPGDYHFNRWLLAYEGFEGRAWTSKIELQGGKFYSGGRTGLNLSGTWRASPHLALTGSYEFNDIDVPQGAFSTNLWRARVNLPFTARSTADAFVQWNSLSQELNTQYRFHLIYSRDSNFYLVFTDLRRDRGAGLIQHDWSVQAKMTYRLYW